MIKTGLDRVLQDPGALARRRYALLSHPAAVTADLEPAHLALSRSSARAPAALFGPEHGYYGLEQDMVASEDQLDPWTRSPILSLYGDSEQSLHPSPESFRDLDLLLIDLQDIGTRYYTFAATAVWATHAALEQGCEVWVLDRPNPLGGQMIEGNLPQAGFTSFVGAFRLPVRHGLTLGELVRLEARRSQWDQAGLVIWTMEDWQREMTWEETGRPWIAPSPNMPTPATAIVYPGACLFEATELSEGRGTTRPFQLLGAPHLSPTELADELRQRALPGVTFLPTYFRPQYQKHMGEACGGVEMVVTDADRFRPYRCGVEVLATARDLSPHDFRWREKPYEFVADRPAIDLLTGSEHCRRSVESGAGLNEWITSWLHDERSFDEERSGILLYS